ncbi:MAG: acyl-CoA dehydrogenase [Rhodospirillaceae bacterium]|nr:acyl-CoA dehydrogenase [Rhodospirillaceae bacterium]
MQMTMTSIPENLTAALGRIVAAEDVVTAAPVAGLMAAFGADDPDPIPGDPLPPLWHGLFCTAKLPPSRLGTDGLAKDEGLLPAAADYPNKLFGGARFDFRSPLRIGDRIHKESEVLSFDLKEGRSGAFISGLVQHRISNGDGIAVVEENDIIFRPASPVTMGGASSQEPPPLPPATATRTVTPDPVLMFRHSALTFNSHRIHYDRGYAADKGYPGLLVQGTLIARLMLDGLEKDVPGFAVGSFAFRSGKPIFDNDDFTIGMRVDGDTAEFWAADRRGFIGMTANVTAVGA